jgi:DsbC/DsbD-like thiol-disulfide interchange protein
MHRMIRAGSLAAAFAMGAAASAPAADDFGEGRARARLVVSGERIEAGSSVILGVRFDIEPGWHIYWRNPGGAGLATEVQWKLPEGLEAGPLRWPLPVAFTQSEGIPGYGYEGSVVLASELRAAPGLDAASAVVGAGVSWLACKERCVLGSATLEAPLNELPVDPGFKSWSERLARPLASGDAHFTVTTTGGLADEAISLWVKWSAPPADVMWFPDPPASLEVGETTVRTRGGLTRIDAPLRLRAGADAPDELRSLIVVDGADGRRRGWELLTEIEP